MNHRFWRIKVQYCYVNDIVGIYKKKEFYISEFKLSLPCYLKCELLGLSD